MIGCTRISGEEKIDRGDDRIAMCGGRTDRLIDATACHCRQTIDGDHAEVEMIHSEQPMLVGPEAVLPKLFVG